MQTEDPPGLQRLVPAVFWSWRDSLQQLVGCQSLRDSELPRQLGFWPLLGSQLGLWGCEGQPGSQPKVPPLFWGWPSSSLLLQLVFESQPGSLPLGWQVSWRWLGSWLLQRLQESCWQGWLPGRF